MPHVRSFVRFLKQSHRQLLAALDIPSRAIYQSYTYTSNGFAASLTSAEARRLKLHPAVAAVEEDEYLPALTSSTSFRGPDTFSRPPEDAGGGQEGGQAGSVRRRKLMTDSPGFLRLPGSLWAANGGQDNAGEGVIVGVIDTGVWPEHPSFANTPSNPYSPVPRRWRGICQATRGFPQSLCSRKFIGARFFPPTPTPLPPRFLSHLPLRLFPPTQPSNKYGPVPRRWRGKCQATRDFPQSLCSRKLIGARFFAAGVRKSSAGVNKEKDFMSPRDGDGHGTWCASAAAGNANVPLTLSSSRTLGSISGVAPRARLATYKALCAAAGNANVPLTLSPTRTHPTEGRRHGSISGVAPRARLATYKALWVTPGGRGGTRGLGGVDEIVEWHPGPASPPTKPSGSPRGERRARFSRTSAQPLMQAVSDGVDVLSCSYGGAISRYFNDLPYLQALKAGVFIAFAAGNSGAPSKGQMIGTLSNTAPFYLTVGASGAPSKGQMIGTLSNTAPFYLTVGASNKAPFYLLVRASTIGREYQANITLGKRVHLTGQTSAPHRANECTSQGKRVHLTGQTSAPHRANECTSQGTSQGRASTNRPLNSPPPFPRPFLSHTFPCLPPTSTIGREYQANLTLGNGVQLAGLGFGSGGNARDLPLVLSSAALHPLGTLSLVRGGRVTQRRRREEPASRALVVGAGSAGGGCQARECFASILDKAKLSGRMLVCNLKTRDVTEAMKDSTTTALGAAAMLLLSTPANLPCHVSLFLSPLPPLASALFAPP
ncbi:unnamed protein product [Closterium sp. NIES-64]|nr:unnamed protein product [Closterium sp. NIES-64]